MYFCGSVATHTDPCKAQGLRQSPFLSVPQLRAAVGHLPSHLWLRWVISAQAAGQGSAS